MFWIYIGLLMLLVEADEFDNSETGENFKSGWKEKELIQWILNDYDRLSRPVFDNVSNIIISKDNNIIQQITVEFGLRLIQILDLNEMEQVLTTSVRLLYRWKDLHLEWDPEEFENITFVFIPSHLIWIPDIALYNYADERLEERRPCAAKIFSDGTVEWQPMAIYKSTCFVNIKYFPFDIQTCWLKFGPWTYDGYRVNITFYNNENYLDLSSLVPSPEWSILLSWANHTEARYPCCEEPYPDIRFFIKIRRSPIFYTYILILPCFLLSSLTLVLFWMPPESPAKMVLGMNIFVAFFLMLLLLQDTTPSASRNFPLIGTYYCINMGIITLSTFLSCVVVNLHFRGDNRQEVPYWLKKLIFNYATKFLCISLGSKVGKYKNEDLSPRNDQPPESLSKKKKPKDYPKYQKSNFHENEQKQKSSYRTLKCSQSIDEAPLSSTQNMARPNTLGEIKTVIVKDCPDELSTKRNSNILSIDQYLQVPLSPILFSKDLCNSDLYKTIESYSPLHSPIFKKNFQFVDETANNDNNYDSYNNRNSLYSSTKLLEDAAALSLSQLEKLKVSLLLENKKGLVIPVKEETKLNSSKNTQTSESDTIIFGRDPEQYKRICNDVKLIVKSLKYIQKLQENKENVARIFTEWRSVGLVLDRIFFYSYLFTVIFSIIMYFPKSSLEE